MWWRWVGRDVELSPLGCAQGCLGMIPFSIVVSAALPVLLDVLLAPGRAGRSSIVQRADGTGSTVTNEIGAPPMSRNQRRNRRNKSGTSQSANRNANRGNAENRSTGAVLHRSSTETKSSLKTTELIAYAGAVLAVIMTALAVDADGEGGNDPFGAESALRYITYLTIGYMIARGLAKSGSYENRIDRDTDLSDDDGARTDESHDEVERDEVERDEVERDEVERDEVGDERGDEVETVDTGNLPSDEVQRAGAGSADAKP